MNFSSGTEKKYAFFFRFAETLFSDMNELMTNVHFRVKKKYGNFETDFIIIDPKFCA